MSSSKIKYFIFGYGSLVNRESIRHTLKRDPGVLYPATLNGWIRDWGIVLDNAKTIGRFELQDDRSLPKYVVALNVRKPIATEQPTNPNGVLFEVSDKDIENMDAREQHYLRMNVTKDIASDVEGTIFAYVGLKKYESLESNKNEAILPLSYLNMVLNGLSDIGDKDGTAFRRTTVFPKILAKDTVYISNL